MSRSALRTLAGLLEQSHQARFLLAFLVVFALKSHTLLDPPAWDAAMGLFPPALTLSSNGFDLVALLGMPGYHEGGPNVHSLSLVTVVTAGMFWLMGTGPATFVALHVLHFAIAAIALAAFYELARYALDGPTSAVLCAAVLLQPTWSAQISYLYLEIPLFLFATLALLAWTRSRVWQAALWAALATATKEPGIIVPVTLATLAVLQSAGLPLLARRLVIIGALPVAWTLARAWLRLAANGSSGFELVPVLDQSFGGTAHYLFRFLLNVPDILLLVLYFAVTGGLLWRHVLRAVRLGVPSNGASEHDASRLSVASYGGVLSVSFLVLFFVILPAAAGFTIVLPRYYVVILPFLLLWLACTLEYFRPQTRLATGSLLGLSLLFAVNTGGVLYPNDINTEGPGNDPALTERSNAYRRLVPLQRAAIKSLVDIADGAPVYYGQYEHYLLNYPALGYSDGPMPNGHNLNTETLDALLGEGGRVPSCAYAVFNYPWLGGEKILEVLRRAEQSPDHSVQVAREFRDGRYAITLFRIQAPEGCLDPY